VCQGKVVPGYFDVVSFPAGGQTADAKKKKSPVANQKQVSRTPVTKHTPHKNHNLQDATNDKGVTEKKKKRHTQIHRSVKKNRKTKPR